MALELASWHDVRKTDETNPRLVVYDVIRTVKDCSLNLAIKTYSRLMDKGLVPDLPRAWVTKCHPSENATTGQYKRALPVCDARQLVQLIWALPGAKHFRQNCADVAVRYLGGDPSLVPEVFQNRAAQNRLAQEQPDHPARIFGEAIEAEMPAKSECPYVTKKRKLEMYQAAVSLADAINMPLGSQEMKKVKTAIFEAFESQPKSFTVRDFLIQKEIPEEHLSKLESLFGRLARQQYYCEHSQDPDTVPSTNPDVRHGIFAYSDADLPTLERAFIALQRQPVWKKLHGQCELFFSACTP